MTSTSQNSQPGRSHPPDEKQHFLKTMLQRSPMQRLRFRFLSSRVFLPVMGSALLSILGIAFLCTEVVKYQAEEEIEHLLGTKVYALDSKLVQANTLAKAFRTSLVTLHTQDIGTPETYRQLTLELFKARPNSIVGLGFGQSPNGILPEQRWLSSYFLLNSDDPNAAGQPLPAPDETIRYVDGTQPGNFYPESERYQNFFLPQIDLWSLPYQSGNGLQTTFYSPIFDDRGKWLGTVFVDIDGRFLQESLAGAVLNDGGFFALLTPEGQVVSAPASMVNSRKADYRSIPGLGEVWRQMAQGEAGLIEGEKGYWAYARLPQNQWLTIAFVPYGAVFNQLAWISIGGTTLVICLLLLVMGLTMRSLNRRLSPILDECSRLAANEANHDLVPATGSQDEITQISKSFFKLLEQVKTSEAQIQQDTVQINALEAQLKQVTTAELDQKMLQAEVEHLFKVVNSVEQGDLLVTAQVGSQKTGLLADTLNRLIRRLEQIMGRVSNHANNVIQNTQQVHQSATLITGSAQQQVQAANRIQTLMNKVNTISQETVLQAIAIGETVEVTRTAIDEGQTEVRGMVQGVNALRQGTNQLVKRTQTLTDYVELTTQFAKDQKRIAAMTRVLAANASMLASRASGQQDPEQFAVITREFETIAMQVNQLASQTNQSLVLLQQRTDQMQTVVSGLDYDLQAMNQQINQFNSGVEQSQQLFDRVQLMRDCVAQLRQQCTESHQAIATAAETTLKSIDQIATIASTTLDQADLTQEQARQIEQQVQTLLHQVEFFQLQPVQRQTNLPQLVGAAIKNGMSDV